MSKKQAKKTIEEKPYLSVESFEDDLIEVVNTIDDLRKDVKYALRQAGNRFCEDWHDLDVDEQNRFYSRVHEAWDSCQDILHRLYHIQKSISGEVTQHIAGECPACGRK